MNQISSGGADISSTRPEGMSPAAATPSTGSNGEGASAVPAARGVESGRFRDVLDRKRARGDSDGVSRKHRARVGERQADDDGAMSQRVSAATMAGPGAEMVARGATARFPSEARRIESAQRGRTTPHEEHGPLTDIRLGASRGSTHLHARIAEGAFAGVELRSTERAGRVEITLIAPGVDLENRLRANLDRLTDAVPARHAVDVTIAVTHAGAQGFATADGHRRPARRETDVDPSQRTSAVRRDPSPAQAAADPDHAADNEWIF